jgi:hypothetical protein
MVMTDIQARALATLDAGLAAVFSNGDDAPMLVRVPLVKDALAPPPPGDDLVAAHMAAWRANQSVRMLFLPRPAYFTADTPANVLNAAGKVLGPDNVHTFQRPDYKIP